MQSTYKSELTSGLISGHTTTKTGFDTSTLNEQILINLESDDIVSRRLKFKTPSPNQFFVDLNSTSSPNLSFSSQPYPGQFTTTPSQFTPAYATLTSQISQRSSFPTIWARSMMEDIQSIEQSVARIENVEKTVDLINMKLGELEVKVNQIDKRVSDVENAGSNISDQYDRQTTELMSVKGTIKTMQDSCAALQAQMKTMERQQEATTQRVLDHKYRDIRENPSFYGIPN